MHQHDTEEFQANSLEALAAAAFAAILQCDNPQAHDNAPLAAQVIGLARLIQTQPRAAGLLAAAADALAEQCGACVFAATCPAREVAGQLACRVDQAIEASAVADPYVETRRWLAAQGLGWPRR